MNQPIARAGQLFALLAVLACSPAGAASEGAGKTNTSVAATPSDGDLSPTELRRLAPSIAHHKQCLQSVSRRLDHVVSDPATLGVQTALKCRPALAPMAEQLAAMGLSQETRALVLARTERLAAEFIAKKAIDKRAATASKP